MRTTRDRKLAIDRLGPLVLSVFGPDSLSNESWREYCEMAVQLRGASSFEVALNFAPSAGPTAEQRRVFVDDFGERLHLEDIRRTVIVSDSLLVRGTLTATSWLLPRNRARVKAFRSDEVTAALTWLHEQSAFDSATALRRFNGMLEEVGWNQRYHVAG